MPKLYSFIVPVYNRPEEIRELLHSIDQQERNIHFELVIVDDGSTLTSEHLVAEFPALNIHYYYKDNTGPGDSRNFGMHKANGDVYIILDSDCILSPNYLKAIDKAQKIKAIDCFGGPDAAHPSFNLRQKAISFVMTSFWTTGGIRGSERNLKRYEPRSFNMGLSKRAFEQSQGFGNLHPGEDPELIHRLWDMGFETCYIHDALVYHKRRITWKSYARQIYRFGLARSILNLKRPQYASWVFWLPLVTILLGLSSIVFCFFGHYALAYLALIYALIIAFTGMIKIKSIKAFYAVPLAFGIQSMAYALGFFEGWVYLSLLKREPQRQFAHMFFNP